MVIRFTRKVAEYISIASLIGTLMGLGTRCCDSDKLNRCEADKALPNLAHWRSSRPANQLIWWFLYYGIGDSLSFVCKPMADTKSPIYRKFQGSRKADYLLFLLVEIWHKSRLAISVYIRRCRRNRKNIMLRDTNLSSTKRNSNYRLHNKATRRTACSDGFIYCKLNGCNADYIPRRSYIEQNKMKTRRHGMWAAFQSQNNLFLLLKRPWHIVP